MALARTNVNTFASGASHGTGSFTTTSFTPGNNSLLCAAIFVENQADTSVAANLTLSGGGLTWTRRAIADSTFAGDDCTAIYTAPVGTGASMTLTLDSGADDIFRYIAHVSYYTGYDTGTPTGATASSASNLGSTPLTQTLSAAPATTSEVLSAGFADGGGTATEGTGWTLQQTNSPDINTKTQTRTGSTSTTVTWNDLSSAGGVSAVAVEIKVAASGAAPFSQTDWPLPQARAFPASLRTWNWSYNRNLIAQDVLPAGRKGITFDRPPCGPLPAGPTWTWAYNQNLIGLDVLPPGRKGQTYDLPPRAYPPPGKTWTWSYNLNLIGKDFMPAGEQSYERPQPADWRRDWSQNLLLSTLSVTVAQPFNQYDWPLPARAPQPDRTWVSSAATLQLMLPPPGEIWTDLPPAPQFWRNGWTQNLVLSTLVAQDALPPGVARYDRPPPIDWRRDWSLNLVLSTLVGQDALPPGAARFDRPPPVDWRRDWSQNLLLSTLTPAAAAPFNQTDWPLPVRAPQPDRTWTQNLVLTTLVGQDALPPGVARTERPPPIDWRRDWSLNLVLSTLVGQDQLPPGEASYNRPQPVAWSRDWSQNLLLSTLAPPAEPLPFNQYDWPLPARALQPDRTYIQTQTPPFVEVPPAFGYVPGAADSYFYDWWRRKRRAVEHIVTSDSDVVEQVPPVVRRALQKLDQATLAAIDTATTPQELQDVAARLGRVERGIVSALMQAADEAERLDEEEAIRAIFLGFL